MSSALFCIPHQYPRPIMHLFTLFHLVTGMLKVTQQENARGDLAITRWQPERSPPKYYRSSPSIIVLLLSIIILHRHLHSISQGIIELQLVVASCYLADTKGAKSSAFGRLTRAAGQIVTCQLVCLLIRFVYWKFSSSIRMDVETLGPNMMKRSESAPNRYVKPIKKLVFATYFLFSLCKI